MKEFKQKKLRTSAGTSVKNRKQAIAIGLSKRNRVCKLTAKSDITKLETRVLKQLEKASPSLRANVKRLLKLKQ